MKNEKQKLMREQLDRKIELFNEFPLNIVPVGGWIKAIRISIGMTLKQLGKKMNVSMQNINQLEQREREGAITINKLKEFAAVLNMKLIYGFLPNDSSLEKMIEKRATQIATEIVMKTSHNMKLENQENSNERLQNAIKNRATKITDEMPSYLWN